MNDTGEASNRSAEIVSSQLLGNTIAVALAASGLILSISQSTTILFWKPLREKKPILVLSVAISDALKSIAYLICDCARVYLAMNGKGEMFTQRGCMIWLIGKYFTTMHSLIAVLCLCIERMLALKWPIWYRTCKIQAEIGLAIASVIIALLSTSGSFIGATDKPQLACTMIASATTEFYTFLIWYQNICIGGIVLSSSYTGIVLGKRWHAARKANADVARFKKDVELRALKSTFAVVLLCLMSFFGSTILMAAVEKSDHAMKAYYGPFVDVFNVMRGVFDFSIYLAFNQEYRQGLMAVIFRQTNQVMPISG